MDINEITTWLKTSIWGIIFLGAIGSTLSVIVIKLIIRAKNFYLDQKEKYKKRRYEYGFYMGGLMGYFIGTNNTGGIVYLATLQIITFVFLLSFSLFFFILFILLFLNDEKILNVGSYFFLITSFTLFYFTLRKVSETKSSANVFISIAETKMEELKKEDNK